MSNEEKKLPAGFEDLQKWAGAWAKTTENERRIQREASTFEEIKEYYDVMLTRVDAALEYLNTKDMNTFDAPDEALFGMTLSLAEVAAPVEWYGQVRVIDGIEPDRYYVDLENRKLMAREKWEEKWT